MASEKREGERLLHQGSAFWDNLSEIFLTKGALKEFDDRSVHPKLSARYDVFYTTQRCHDRLIDITDLVFWQRTLSAPVHQVS